MRQYIMQLLGIPIRDNKENVGKAIYENIIYMYFSELKKDLSLHRVQRGIIKNKSTLYCSEQY